jgi:hypothetical protein
VVRDLVIGPQGVIEVVDMSGTHLGAWAGMTASGRTFAMQIIIHFPWDPAAKKFSGENVYYDSGLMSQLLSPLPGS